jgi:replicative DNA helicase
MAVGTLDFALDKPLPQNPEAERSILGSIILDNHSLYRVAGALIAEDFYRDAHRVIFEAMTALAEQSRPIDLLTLKEELSKRSQLEAAGGSAYISSLIDGIPDLSNIERYAAIVKEKSTMRRLVLLGSSMMKAAIDAPNEPADVLDLAERSIFAIAEQNATTGFISIDRITQTNLAAIEKMQHAGRLLTGLPTGFDAFNEMTSGFQKQDLLILAARPSMGKTSLMLNIAEALSIPDKSGSRSAEDLHAVGIFSLEMSKEQLGLRILSSEASVSSQLIRAGILSERNWNDLAEAASRVARAPIWIDDTPSIDIMELRAKARRLKREHRLDMIMVDYLQLMTARSKVESRQQEISAISRGLKGVAKELDVPLLSLSQLSRKPDQRTGDHRPQLSDLRESGSIEQDADIVFFIYRDEVYNKESEDRGVAEIIIAKQRNGPIGDFKLVFRNDITKFLNYMPEPEYM